MADAKKTEEKEAPAPKQSSSLVKYILLAAVMVLVPAGIAVALVLFVVQPRLAAPAEKTKHAETMEEEAFPAEAFTVDFDEAQANVMTENPNAPAPILTFAVSMVMTGGKAGESGGGHGGGGGDARVKLIKDKQSFFTALLGKLHRNRTRKELNDPQVQESILKQAKQEANVILKKLYPEQNIQVIEVMYTKYAIFDL